MKHKIESEAVMGGGHKKKNTFKKVAAVATKIEERGC